MAQLLDIYLSDIQRDIDQPRKDFNVEALQELADSISAIGVVQAITVRRTPPGVGGAQYMIVAGERRWRASTIAGKQTVPAILKEDFESNIENVRAMQLTENLFHERLNPVEKAEFLKNRIDQLKEASIADPISQVAFELGVSNSWVSKNTAILKVGEDIRSLARIGKIRDYSIVKKLDALTGDKRSLAVEQIQNDIFNAKEFFKRKRYDRVKTDDRAGQGDGVNSKPAATKQPTTIKSISIKTHEMINIISKTEYNFVLEEKDPGWRQNNELLPNYFNNFKEWANASN